MDSFLNCVVSNTALAGVLALAAFGLQKFWRSPQLAHALWFLVLVKLVTPPVFSVVLPDRLVLSASRVAAPKSSGDARHLRPSADAERAWALTPSPSRPARGDGEPNQAAVDSPAGSAEMTGMSTSPARSGAFAASSLANLLAARWQGWLCGIWAAGVIIGVVTLRRRLDRCRTLLIEAVDADAELVDDVRAFAKKLGIRRCPSIRVLDAHVPPLVCAGWSTLFLLVPARLLRELDREQLHAVVVHELAHIRRGDHLMRWFEIFVRGIFWWNPVAWWASSQLRQAEEECCDAWVVWALPDGQRSYGKALLWTVEFLAECRVVPVVAGTAFGDSHIKRRIEMVMKRKLNRKMSWGALLMVVMSAVCVLPVAAQKRPDTDAADRGVAERESQPETLTQSPKAAAESRDLEARIERLERLLQELTESLKAPASNSGNEGQINRDTGRRTESDIEIRYSAVAAKIAEKELERILAANRKTPGTVPDKEVARARLAVAERTGAREWNNRLKESLLAIDKQAWDAAATRDWKKYEKLLADDYYGFYVNSSGTGRADKATSVAAVKRRRYFDVSIQDVIAKRIGNDTAILTYIYSCQVEEAGQLQSYRDHQLTQVWTQKADAWVLSFSQDFILPGGE